MICAAFIQKTSFSYAEKLKSWERNYREQFFKLLSHLFHSAYINDYNDDGRKELHGCICSSYVFTMKTGFCLIFKQQLEARTTLNEEKQVVLVPAMAAYLL